MRPTFNIEEVVEISCCEHSFNVLREHVHFKMSLKLQLFLNNPSLALRPTSFSPDSISVRWLWCELSDRIFLRLQFEETTNFFWNENKSLEISLVFGSGRKSTFLIGETFRVLTASKVCIALVFFLCLLRNIYTCIRHSDLLCWKWFYDL